MKEYYEILEVVKTRPQLRRMNREGNVVWPTSDGTNFHYVNEPKPTPGKYPKCILAAPRVPGATFKLARYFQQDGLCGEEFCIQYLDGCFYPFVFRIKPFPNQ